MLKFNYKYFLITISLFIVELLIALYVKDQIIRPYIGDVLVVILIYCLVKSFFDLQVVSTAIGVLIFSYVIEVLQYFHYVTWFGMQDSNLANIILGTSFAWTDLLAYTAGILIVLFSERMINKPKQALN